MRISLTLPIFKKPIFVSLFFIPIVLFSQTASISPTIDTYIRVSQPNTSYGTSDIFRLKHSVSESGERTAWIKFSTATMPSNSEQILLKLYKTSGDEGNITLRSAEVNFDNTATWNNPPTAGDHFEYGGMKLGDTYYFDVTQYVNTQLTNGASEFAFNLYSTSSIVSTMSFASTEAADVSTRPALLFYDAKAYNITLYNYDFIADGIEVVDEGSNNGTYDADLLLDHANQDTRSSYGGWSEFGTSTATGYFRVEKDCDDTWHIIDPEGYYFYSAGINSVSDEASLSIPNDIEVLGINTMGSWSDENISGMAYCPRFNVLNRFKNTDPEYQDLYNNMEILPVFEPAFVTFCEDVAQNELTPYINDPWVLGYFLDNELLFHKDQLVASLGLDTDNAQYIAADTWMIDRYGSGYSMASITTADENDYRGYVAETYFSIVAPAFKAEDPNHMLLGTRFHAGVKDIPQIFAAASTYLDIISVNYYGDFEPIEGKMEMWMDEGERPFMITEYYTKGNDVGLPNLDGAGWNVPTQEDRIRWFQNWTIKLLRNKGNVGAHWFRFIDNNESNKGLYSVGLTRYDDLANAMEKMYSSIYSLRSHVLYGNDHYNCHTPNNEVLNISKYNTDKTQGIEVYPIPFKDSFKLLNTDTNEKILAVNLMNVNGSIIVSKTIKESTEAVTIDTANLSSGLYILEVITKNTTTIKKLVKK